MALTKRPSRIVVCGDRNGFTEDRLYQVLSWLTSNAIIIEGGAKGVDQQAGEFAVMARMPHVIVPAQWGNFGRAAGPIRNEWMAHLEPDQVIAFHRNIDESRGTKHMLELAGKLGIPWYLYEK